MRSSKSDIKSEIKYHISKSNKTTKYAIIALDEHWQSLGLSNNPPKVINKSNTFDFENGTTIEHIYPRNPTDGNEIADCDILKHNLGNITILSETENKMADNTPYEDKKPILSQTNSLMNQSIPRDYFNWNKDSIESRQEDLEDKLCKIFKISLSS